jgi:hypothetical protein
MDTFSEGAKITGFSGFQDSLNHYLILMDL